MNFDFITAQRIIFGAGKIFSIGDLTAGLGNNPLLITGSGDSNSRVVKKLLEEANLRFQTFSVSEEPTTDLIQEVVRQGKSSNCDVVIGLGGGSAIDTAKASAALLTNSGDIMDYLEVIGKGQPLKNPPMPFIAIPTTAGPGSEVTKNAVLKHRGHQVKVSLRHPLMLADIALIDPELTLSVPPAVTASTGMDALTQLLESFVSAKANSMTDMFCREGLPRAARSLLKAFKNGGNLDARTDMAWASLLGGLALANAGLGAAHGFAGPLGGLFPAPHGAVCASLLPAVVRVNVNALKSRLPAHPSIRRYQMAAAMLTSDPDATIEDGIQWLTEISKQLDIPSLRTFGLTVESIPELVQKSSRSSSMKANPIKLTDEEMTDILLQAL
ncbi:MAG: iron-containing alcohol dehydrogenase [Anaerolineaceae bacterium]|nr:iron-containing alcohol dehydrogenase [Anaerolineaceae bacterium]